MNISVTHAASVKFSESGACLMVPLYQGELPLNATLLDPAHELVLQAQADRGVLTGKAGQCAYLPVTEAPYSGVLILGAGERAKLTPEGLRRAAGAAAKALTENRITSLVLDVSHFPELPVDALLEGIILGQYDFDAYRSKRDGAPPRLAEFTVALAEGAEVNAPQKACELAALACFSANGARHLANTPPNEMTPAALAEFAEGIARDSGCECTVLEERQMETLGMNALLAVGRGSAQDSKLIVLRHHVSNDLKTIAIVGKGVTFDTGGISIKPAADMHEMKYDMCGAAAVLCAMMTIVELRPAINVICVVPSVENMPSGMAARPGDILRAYNGKTIEVRNTDAEGRLILADAMAYTADKYKPDVMVDLATLTGACVVALGHNAAGLFSNNETLSQELAAAGEATGERVWSMPLWDEHGEMLKSPHADLSNVGPRWGGAISAASFLSNFIGDTPAWAHLDIAGTAWGASHQPHLSADHASGFGVRLLVKWILDQAGQG
ncbi:MAG: leucyl aminopeptidase [Candidatus Hydrogenedens sp.]|nr:leucyl aminopeptidase [Candidatus Hydrogenedens sp.]